MTVKWSLIAAKCIQDEFSTETETDNERIEFGNGRKIRLRITIGFKELLLIAVQQFVKFVLRFFNILKQSEAFAVRTVSSFLCLDFIIPENKYTCRF